MGEAGGEGRKGAGGEEGNEIKERSTKVSLKIHMLESSDLCDKRAFQSSQFFLPLTLLLLKSIILCQSQGGVRGVEGGRGV